MAGKPHALQAVQTVSLHPEGWLFKDSSSYENVVGALTGSS